MIELTCEMQDWIRKDPDLFDFSYLTKKYKLSESLIEEFQSEFYWSEISKFQELSESFIDKFYHKINWDQVCWSDKISLDLIKKYEDFVNWNILIQKYKFEEKYIEYIIENFNTKIDCYFYCNLFVYQDISNEFLDKFADKADWRHVSNYNRIYSSKYFISKYFTYLQKYIMEMLENPYMSEDIKNYIRMFI